MGYAKLIKFCERIEKQGKPEQQYVAEGIRALLGDRINSFLTNAGYDHMKSEEEKMIYEAKRGLFPGDFPEKGFIVELADGSRWKVDALIWRASEYQKAPDYEEDEAKFTLKHMFLDFTAEDVKDGTVKVIR